MAAIGEVLVYRGLGALDDFAAMLLQRLESLINPQHHVVGYITPEQIVKGGLNSNVRLLVIGGGYDLGLISALGDSGMVNIGDYVRSGGSYLGACSGAYFACDRIEFDKGGPLEVVGDRKLKFFPGVCVGPLYNPYDYNSRSGAVAALVDFQTDATQCCGTDAALVDFRTDATQCCGTDLQQSLDKHWEEMGPDGGDTAVLTRAYFSGGGRFVMDTEHDGRVKVLSRLRDLPDPAIACVECEVEKGVAVLTSCHLETLAADIDDGDPLVEDMVPVLRQHDSRNMAILRYLLHRLHVKVL